MTYKTSRYMTCVETAKLVRKALKTSFPSIKFSVRSKNGTIRIAWTDGPTDKQVRAATSMYEGKLFDSSIDLGCFWDSWLMPDGTAALAKGRGTAGSMGYIDAVDCPKPHPDAELVHFGSSYVSTSREFSVDSLTAMAEKVSKQYGLPAPKVLFSTWDGAYLAQAEKFVRVSGQYTLNELIYRAAA